MPETAARQGRLLLILSFLCIWFVWGSTFLTIRHVIHTIPPLLMCGIRLLAAGALLGAFGAATGALWPRGVEWRNAALVGILLPGIGNVTVTIGVAHVPSGLVALLVGTIPLWMALLASLGPHGVPPSRQAGIGLVLGFAGIALLIGPSILRAGMLRPGMLRSGIMGAPGGGELGANPAWALVPVLGSLSWSWGSLWSRRIAMPTSGDMSTAIGLTAAGLGQLVVAALAGDFAHWQPAAVPWTAWAALAYLVVFGSALGFGSYLYLLRRVPPAVVATYAFVNPVVAMTLGWAFGGEALGPRTFAAAAVVLAAVALITTAPPAVRAVVAPAGAVPARQG